MYRLKSMRPVVALLVVLSVLSGPAVVLTGCATSASGKVYQGTNFTVTTVKAAVKGFNDLYQAGLFTEDDRLVVIDVYDKFRAGAKSAVAAGRLLSDTDDPTALTGDLADLARKVMDTITALKKKRGVS